MKLAGAYINDDKYERLVALAEQNNRTLAGQCRHLFDRALSGELQVPPCTAAVAAAGAVRAPRRVTRVARGQRHGSKLQGLGLQALADPVKSPCHAVKEGAL